MANQPNRPTQLSPTSRVLGFNINGSRTMIVYSDINGLIFEKLIIETPRKEPFGSALGIINNAADKLLTMVRAQRLPNPDILSAAISGDIDVEHGTIMASPDLPEWRSIAIKSRLEVSYNIPVIIEQEANAAALAEYYYGSGQGVKNLVFLSMEPTLRAGILTNGRVFRGGRGRSGRIGDVIISEHGPAGYGDPGSLNGFASAAGILELAHLRFPNNWPLETGVDQIMEAARSGDVNARQVFLEAGNWLGKGICPLVRLLDPEVILVGYPGSLLEEVMLNPARQALAEVSNLSETNLPKLLPAKLGSKLPEMTAIAPAIHCFRKKESAVSN